MAKKPKRETVTYQLRHDRKVVYIGTTSDPERREQGHRAEGKRFTKLVVTSRCQEEEGRAIRGLPAQPRREEPKV